MSVFIYSYLYFYHYSNEVCKYFQNPSPADGPKQSSSEATRSNSHRHSSSSSVRDLNQLHDDMRQQQMLACQVCPFINLK